MKYTGKHISGEGSQEKLELIDRSFSMLRSSPLLPNLKMLYKSLTDMLSEGFIWGTGWWMQNSFGFTMGAIPLMDELWSQILFNSYDAFWRRIGDGKRVGTDNGLYDHEAYTLCAPDGSLGDCVNVNGIIYKQGDGDFYSYDWFYEATAAGVLITAEMLLFDRNSELIAKYVPLMKRSVNHIETVRAENDLFLVGPACNLLAPSYGGSFNEETGEEGKGYLTGISITYSAALKKLIEVLKLAEETEFAQECSKRLARNLNALPLLLTEEGYFAKSMDPDGTKHGVYGAKKYGYLEAVCNVDAIAWDVVSQETAEKIYDKIAEVEGIRPAGVLCNNYPHLDDTLISYRSGSSGPDSLKPYCSGDWVDGGCWCTVEGRAILAYHKLGKYEDAYKAASYYMKWAEEYRQDEPLSQWGFNTRNQWQKENTEHTVIERPCAIMIDNFAAVTCLLRGMFDFAADAKGLSVKPQIPEDITKITQHEPLRFAGCSIYINYVGGDGPLHAVLGSEPLEIDENGRIQIPVSLFENQKEVCLSISRSGNAESISVDVIQYVPEISGDIEGVPEDLRKIYEECREKLETAEGKYAMQLREILLSTEAAAMRRKLPFDKHELRPMTADKIELIIGAYDNTVRELYKGLAYRQKGKYHNAKGTS